MKAAVVHAPGEPMVVEDVELDEPHAGEVLVRLVATGVCHTDVSAWRGDKPLKLPAVLGHEGAGVVESVGPGVTAVAPGDHVVLAVAPRCGRCPACVVGQPQLCRTSGPVLFAGTMLDGTTRLHRHGAPLHHFFCQSSYAERAVVPEGAAVPIRRDAPLATVAPLACGASTGLGAVLNAARVEEGASVAIVGCGGVGLSAVMAARLAHAATIVAIDIAAEKLALAGEFGATHLVDATRDDPVECVRALTGVGVQHAFEFVGSRATLEQMVQLIAPGGHGYVIGAGPAGTAFSVDANAFLFNRHLHGVVGGNIRPTVDIPRFVDLFMAGHLPLDRLVTRTYPLDRINEAFSALDGTTDPGRGVIVH